MQPLLSPASAVGDICVKNFDTAPCPVRGRMHLVYVAVVAHVHATHAVTAWPTLNRHAREGTPWPNPAWPFGLNASIRFLLFPKDPNAGLDLWFSSTLAFQPNSDTTVRCGKSSYGARRVVIQRLTVVQN
jgi:hypothetical protein